VVLIGLAFAGEPMLVFSLLPLGSAFAVTMDDSNGYAIATASKNPSIRKVGRP